MSILLIDVHLSQHKVSSLALENSFLQYGDVRDTMQTQLLGIKNIVWLVENSWILQKPLKCVLVY